jgi:hypothetical protein
MKFNERDMTIDLYEDGDIIIRGKYVVCDECNGAGYHLTPGLRGDVTEMVYEMDYEEREEFMEEYTRRGGIYDVQCEKCDGKRVTMVPMTFSKEWDDYWRDHYETEAIYAAERAMGA